MTEDATLTVELPRDGDRTLVFDGVLLGSGTSRRRGRSADPQRWFEVRIYRTVGGTYVVAGTGRSVVSGETDRHWAVTCADPSEVVVALTRRDPDLVEYVTRTARDALDEAGRRDAGIRDAFLQRVP